MKKYFVVSDVHSFYNELIKSLNEKGFEKENPNHYLILCGDLFDRGLQANQLLNFVQSLGDRFLYVRGNHEDLLFKCVYQIVQGFSVDGHHISNGTLDTISQLTGISQLDLMSPRRRTEEMNQQIYNKMKPILEWIDNKSKNYYEIGDYIFVHGWIPYKLDWENSNLGRKTYVFDSEWNKEPDKEDISGRLIYQSKWDEARWINGMVLWKQGIKIPNKTICCGHWHCSYGHSHIDQKRKEFPEKNRKDWEKSFEPYIKEGIIAIDACTAYSGIVNCFTFEVEE